MIFKCEDKNERQIDMEKRVYTLCVYIRNFEKLKHYLHYKKQEK